MLREDLSEVDLESLLASLSFNRYWDVATKFAATLGLNPWLVAGDLGDFIADLDDSLAELVASGSVNPVRFTVYEDYLRPNPASRSQKNWTLLAGLMHFLPGNFAFAHCDLPPQLVQEAYGALILGAQELARLGYEPVNMQPIVGRATALAQTIGEEFVAWADSSRAPAVG